jgi:hypothetical protein
MTEHTDFSHTPMPSDDQKTNRRCTMVITPREESIEYHQEILNVTLRSMSNTDVYFPLKNTTPMSVLRYLADSIDSGSDIFELRIEKHGSFAPMINIENSAVHRTDWKSNGPKKVESHSITVDSSAHAHYLFYCTQIDLPGRVTYCNVFVFIQKTSTHYDVTILCPGGYQFKCSYIKVFDTPVSFRRKVDGISLLGVYEKLYREVFCAPVPKQQSGWMSYLIPWGK